MAITAKFLRDIEAEARPVIERQMADAKLIAGFRTVVANAGGDWGALKALIKAQVEDENDESGDGKRVQKIIDKADDTAAYADMLGLANMNKKNFIPPHNPETGELTDTQEQPEEPARTAPVVAAEATGNDLREPVAAEQGQIVREGDAPRETDCQAGEASQDGSDASCPDSEFPSPETPQAIADDEAAQAQIVVGTYPPSAADLLPGAVKAPEADLLPASGAALSKPGCLKLKDGHCKISFQTSALCSECNRAKAEKSRV